MAVLIGQVDDNLGVRQGPDQAGHREAVGSIDVGAPLRKAGRVIGRAAHAIAAGTVLTAADVLPTADEGTEPRPALPPVPEAERATFQGYVRADGRVGTRNTIGVFVVGNCGATAARQAADFFDADQLAPYPNVDAVVPYVHEIGCGMEMTGEPMDLLRRTLSGTIRNPNTFGTVVIALGCERNNLRGFLEQEKLAVGDRLHTITIQDIGGIRKAVEEAKRLILAMLPEANAAWRSTVSVAHLVLGLQSGAAAGFCGIS
ncbi:MAG: UxaA family hydrolase, partial [Janthinobacterium lividum]